MTIPETMTGVQLIGHGGPEKLVWNEVFPTPQPGPGEALVRVLAAGVNNTDINTKIGWYAKDITDSTEEVDPDANVDAVGWSGALRLVSAGQVRPLVSKTYPLTEIDVAQADFSAKKYPGKLVLIPPQN